MEVIFPNEGCIKVAPPFRINQHTVNNSGNPKSPTKYISQEKFGDCGQVTRVSLVESFQIPQPGSLTTQIHYFIFGNEEVGKHISPTEPCYHYYY